MPVMQDNFAAGLLDAALPTPDGLITPDGAPAHKRYNVYRNNVVVSLTEALEVAFPVIRKLVGEAFFQAMAGVFLRAHPPSAPMLMHYGGAMPDFLASFAPVAHLPYLPDVARLELALRQSYHAADAAPIDATRLQDLTGDDLLAVRMTFAPALAVLTSDYPITAILRANTDPGAPKPVMRPECALITRPEFDPRVDQISAAQATCLVALIGTSTLGDAIDRAGDTLDLGGLLGLLIQRNAISDLY